MLSVATGGKVGRLNTKSGRMVSRLDTESESPERPYNKALYEGVRFMMVEWQLSAAALGAALRIPTSTITHWLRQKKIPVNRSRISNDAECLIHMLAIHRSLRAMLEDGESQREWLRTFRKDLGSIPWESISESIQGLLKVRQFLDFQRGRGA